ncbi:putative clathrin, heavy chain [Rosa chinensis]|uniref:Putative clathrin, heavy chain n=1 Tax=Rosa chinensis TaxID=74649 RepID=A0A2P6RNW6_ROSCH|nr:putative clathrin, heavy chain [Rosa chinensis]
MESKSQTNKTKKTPKHPSEPVCTKPSCFFCTMNEPNPSFRKSKIIKLFKDLPLKNDQEQVLALSSLWNIAMKQPNDPEFPSLGIFECMAKLINKGINDKKWLLSDQNIYIPYYAAHIVGSYTMNKAQFAEKALKSGVVLPLMELMRGKITWVEQRVAVRALGHMAGHDGIVESIIALKHEVKIVELAMKIASTCLKRVKAEEWGSQLQCWSLNLLNCFVSKERCLGLICKKEFLVEVCGIWGGLANPNSPGGIGLLKALCQTKFGRQSVANSQEVIERLCSLSRSSDEWKLMAVDCLLLLLKDPETRIKVVEISVVYLVDLVEMRKPKLGDRITQMLLQDYHKIKYGDLRLGSKKAERALEEIWDLKVERKKKEKLMSKQEIRERKSMVGKLKKQGNMSFWAGNIEKAVIEYSEALDLCPLKMRRERIVVYSNRAQCYLLMKNPEAAISDTTRALCLSTGAARVHGKSLWRRSQAYEMKGLARESLMDCLEFVNGKCLMSEQGKGGRIPYYAARMISKQMRPTWMYNIPEEDFPFTGKPTIVEEMFTERRRKVKKGRRKEKGVNVNDKTG